jgi:hypothetical protein
MLQMLHDPLSSNVPFTLVFKRWRRQALASAEKLFYHVTVALRGISAHAWHLSMTQQILALSCSNLQPTTTTLSKVELRHFVMVAWCAHLDLIPREKVVYIPEPQVPHVCGPTMFLNPEDIIHHDQPTLRYRVKIDILEIVD